MNMVRCDGCGGDFSMNDTQVVREQVFCNECCEEFLSENKEVTGAEVCRQMDPTVCINCGADNGQESLGTMAGLATCEQCQDYFRHRPFPAWIKGAMVGLIALVVFSLLWNARFVRAYFEMKESFKILVEGDFEQASSKMESARQRVPESEMLEVLSSYQRGLFLLNQGKSAESLKLLQECREKMGPVLDEVIMQAKMGVAFDEKDYDKFLALSLEEIASKPDEAYSLQMAASAYACKYAVTGDEQFKEKSLANLERAGIFSGDNPDLKAYEQRIRHRLYSREIIEREEFVKRYPDGWTEPGKE